MQISNATRARKRQALLNKELGKMTSEEARHSAGTIGSFANLVRNDSLDYGGISNGATIGNNAKKDQPYVDNVDLDVYTNTEPTNSNQAEPSMVLFFQVLFPFLIAGLGMVCAGILLDYVQHWALFKEVPETFILVPALLGLKGNLEMTLASRLSTQANTGKMDTTEQILSVAVTNIALIQTQAIVVTFLACGSAVLLAWVPRGNLDFGHAALLCASSLTTASLASFILGGIMILVVLVSRRYYVNPDNVATPIAASLGDLITLSILSVFGSLFLSAHKTESYLNSIVIIAFILALPIWIVLASRDNSTLSILRNGWSPIIFSMMISSSGGFVLETAVKNYTQLALFQPVLNGVGGNLAAVHASRLTTYYHKTSTLGTLPNSWTVQRFYSFSRAFFSNEWDARSARVLIFLVVPGHIFFNFLIKLLHMDQNPPPSSALFTSLYLFAALAQVCILLFVCQWLVAFMWSWKIDPDNASIPYLTALGDLLGTCFLYMSFSFLSFVGSTEITKRVNG
ncbi:Solute carrier family 41 member 1 [Aphelenchoides bicaudatus]|nr:Solute carrier family 41 member 1 [Aphelenchoides bicaudatus]